MAFKDLREFISFLEAEKELRRIKKTVATKYEIAAYIRHVSDTKGPALLFGDVADFDTPVVGGLFATRKRALLAMGVADGNYVDKFLRALDHPLAPKTVASGPCKEVIWTGDEIDLNRFPHPIFSEKDSARFITAGIVISKDPETGNKNTSCYRIQVIGRNRLGMNAQQLFRQYKKAEAKGEPLPVAIAIGTDPAILLATQWQAPYGTDEMELAGSLRGEAVEVVKAETVDLEVPATAEIVIEGNLLPKVREEEGPFGEVSGYYNPAYPKPVIEVTAITHRKDPIYHTALTGMPITENHVLKQIPLEAAYYWQLKKEYPGVTAVHFPAAGTVGFIVVIAMKQIQPCEARNIIATMMGSRRNKIIIVVDDDVDIYDMDKVLWAVATRSQPAEDVVIFPRLKGSSMDPTSGRTRVTSSMGIDATKPFGEPFPEMVKVPGAEDISLDD